MTYFVQSSPLERCQLVLSYMLRSSSTYLGAPPALQPTRPGSYITLHCGDGRRSSDFELCQSFPGESVYRPATFGIGLRSSQRCLKHTDCDTLGYHLRGPREGHVPRSPCLLYNDAMSPSRSPDIGSPIDPITGACGSLQTKGGERLQSIGALACSAVWPFSERSQET